MNVSDGSLGTCVWRRRVSLCPEISPKSRVPTVHGLRADKPTCAQRGSQPTPRPPGSARVRKRTSPGCGRRANKMKGSSSQSWENKTNEGLEEFLQLSATLLSI